MGPRLALAALLPLVPVLALPATNIPAYPSLHARGEIHDAVVRIGKCSGLFTTNHEGYDGGWELGIAAFFDTAAAAVPTKQATFEMKHQTDDNFVDGDPKEYAAKYEVGDGSITLKIVKAGQSPAPPPGLWVGSFIDSSGGKRFSYNCFVPAEAFEWTDPKYKKCRTKVVCSENDAIVVGIHGSKEVTTQTDRTMAPLGEIVKLMDEVYDPNNGLCDPEPQNINGIDHCTVKFECSNNAKIVTSVQYANLLKDQLKNLDDPSVTKIEKKPSLTECTGIPECVPIEEEYTWITVPKEIQLSIRGSPAPETSGEGYEIARLKATIECNEDAVNDLLCGAFGAVFGVAGIYQPLEKIAPVGGVITDAACG